jgi:hypothetical protein
LRTEAEVVGVDELLMTHAPVIGLRGDYRRAVNVEVEAPLALNALRFSLFFLALARCLCQATFLVLFIGCSFIVLICIMLIWVYSFLSAAGGEGWGSCP